MLKNCLSAFNPMVEGSNPSRNTTAIRCNGHDAMVEKGVLAWTHPADIMTNASDSDTIDSRCAVYTLTVWNRRVAVRA